MRNKLVCLLLVSSMFVSFVACGNEVDTNKEKESNVSSSEEKANDEGEEVSAQRYLAEMLIHSSISMQNLQVVSVYTTDNEESSSNGAMTLTCKVGNQTIDVRTVVLKDANGDVITEDVFYGKNINVKGMVDYFRGSYQIKVFSMNDITFN